MVKMILIFIVLFLLHLQPSLTTEVQGQSVDPPAFSSPWFQVVGGSLYAKSGVTSNVPYYGAEGPCLPANNCRPALITWWPFINNGAINSPGFPITGNGTIVTHYNPSLSQNFIHNPLPGEVERTQAELGHAVDPYFRLSQQDYQYFFNKFGYRHTSNVLNNSKRPSNLSPGLNVFFHNGHMVIDEDDEWDEEFLDKLVVFVDGNLTINSTSDYDESSGRIIRADVGGYLAFIVSGDIIISPNVGYWPDFDPADPAFFAFALPGDPNYPPNVEGVFLADGDLIIGSNDDSDTPDKKFIGAGTFVGWTNVQLERTYEGGFEYIAPEPTATPIPTAPPLPTALTFSGATHTEEQCVSAGGTVHNTGGTGTICRFGLQGCPGGWSQASYWHRFNVASWDGDTCSRHSSSGPTTFSNTAAVIKSRGSYVGMHEGWSCSSWGNCYYPSHWVKVQEYEQCYDSGYCWWPTGCYRYNVDTITGTVPTHDRRVEIGCI